MEVCLRAGTRSLSPIAFSILPRSAQAHSKCSEDPPVRMWGTLRLPLRGRNVLQSLGSGCCVYLIFIRKSQDLENVVALMNKVIILNI